jgi:adenylate cyclase
VDIRDVGRQLGVRYVLEGSVRKIGDAVRINAQLISTDNGAHVWADRFDQPLHDLQNGQDSAVQRMGAALDIKVDRGREQPKTSTPDPSAYDLVLRARAVMQERLSYVRNVIAGGHFDEHRQGQERRIAEGIRRAGLRDHLDEWADFHIASGGYLRDAVNTPTPTGVPGGTTKPLILTTTAENPTIPGASWRICRTVAV